MKPVSLVLVAVVLAVAVDCASHHRKHSSKTRNEEVTEEPGDDGDLEWPEPDSVKNFEVPDAFTLNGVSDGRKEPSAGKHHGRTGHRSHS